jgi:hypothetical protein
MRHFGCWKPGNPCSRIPLLRRDGAALDAVLLEPGEPVALVGFVGALDDDEVILWECLLDGRLLGGLREQQFYLAAGLADVRPQGEGERGEKGRRGTGRWTPPT